MKVALEGKTNLMITMTRTSQDPYTIEYGTHPLRACANTEKKLPKEFINSKGNGVTKKFLDYVIPLIQGEHKPAFKDGIQKFSKIIFK